MRIENGQPATVPEVTLRIPGTWSGPKEFVERLPPGCRCTPELLTLDDGSEFELNVLPADDEFPRIFAGSCPQLPTESERERIENFTVNICLTGPGGSLDAAERLMQAAAAVLDAGGAGVFVDNSGIAHGATDWLTLLGHARDGGAYWAFISAIGGHDEVYSIGMHILGHRDAVIPSTGDAEHDSRTLHSFLGYTVFSGNTVHDGDILGDALLPTFRAYHQPHDRVPPDAPMFNPHGEWRLVPFAVEQN